MKKVIGTRNHLTWVWLGFHRSQAFDSVGEMTFGKLAWNQMEIYLGARAAQKNSNRNEENQFIINSFEGLGRKN